MPDGKGYVMLLRATAPSRSTAAPPTGPIAALGIPRGPAATSPAAIAVMPDGAGYVVLDNVRRRVASTAPPRRAPSARARTQYFGVDLGRDIVIVVRRTATLAFGYYVARRAGAACSTPQRARPGGTNAVGHAGSATAGAASTIYGGKPFAAAQRRQHHRSLTQTRRRPRRSPSACVRGRRRSAAPRPAPSCGTRPRPRRAGWSRSRSGRGRGGPRGTGRSASGSRATGGSRRTTTA